MLLLKCVSYTDKPTLSVIVQNSIEHFSIFQLNVLDLQHVSLLVYFKKVKSNWNIVCSED